MCCTSLHSWLVKWQGLRWAGAGTVGKLETDCNKGRAELTPNCWCIIYIACHRLTSAGCTMLQAPPCCCCCCLVFCRPSALITPLFSLSTCCCTISRERPMKGTTASAWSVPRWATTRSCWAACWPRTAAAGKGGHVNVVAVVHSSFSGCCCCRGALEDRHAQQQSEQHCLSCMPLTGCLWRIANHGVCHCDVLCRAVLCCSWCVRALMCPSSPTAACATW